MALKTDFIDGDILYAGTTSDTDKLNGITTQINTNLTKINEDIGTVKTQYYPEKTSTNTTATTNKLVDSTAPFTDLYLGKNVFVKTFDLSYVSWTGTGLTDVVRKTFILGSSSSGVLIPTNTFSNTLFSGSTTTLQCYLKYYYTDASTDVSGTQSLVGPASATTKYYTNPQVAKEVYKIEVITTSSHASYFTGISNDILQKPISAKITAIDSTTTVSIDADIFLATGMTYEVSNLTTEYYITPIGTTTRTLTDSDSLLNGITLPILYPTDSSTQPTKLYFIKVK